MERTLQTAAPSHPGKGLHRATGSESEENFEAIFLQAYPLARRAAQVHAAAAIASGGMSYFDREDMEQEGQMACWRALPRFNPSRASLRTFIEHVVGARMISLHRARRSRRSCEPLGNFGHPTGNPTTRLASDLSFDVRRIVGALTGSDRQLAIALMEHTPSEASSLLGIPRSSIYRRIRLLQPQFVSAGLVPHPTRRRRRT